MSAFHSNVIQLPAERGTTMRDNLGLTNCGGLRSARFPVTHRVYVRWPDRRVSDKTTTESLAVAEFAYKELLARPDLVVDGALGVSWTENNKQRGYQDYEVEDSPPLGQAKG